MPNIAEIFQSLDYGPATESASEAQAWLDKHGRRFGHFVGGAWRKGSGHFPVKNPALDELLAEVAQGGAKDVDAAVKAARAAQGPWAALGGHGRARYLYALARHLQKHARLFAVLETLDNGKSIRETRDLDIPLAIRHFYHHAGWAQIMDQEFPGYEAVGVAGQVIPWNFPLLMLAWKVAPALAMGNTVVLKPAELTPLTALAFAELAQAAGLPPGVLNIVTGDGETGAALVAHPGVDKIAFTGSTEVGRIIRKATAGTGKKLTLELGGKSPFIVFDDADLDAVVEGVVDAIWFNQGQVCCAGSRLLVQEGVQGRLIARLRERMETLRVGDPLSKSVDMGAIVDPVQLERIRSLVAQGVAEGANCWQPSGTHPSVGCFYPPTLLTEIQPASTVAQVEIFGPVLCVMGFRTPAEAVELANNTVYGLAASVWTENINLALDIAPKVKAGVVWVNCTNQFDAAVGFGGYRESGFGREGGREGLWDYIRPIWEKNLPLVEPSPARSQPGPEAREGAFEMPPLDRTPKLYIGGKQVRADGGYSLTVHGFDGRPLGQVGDGSRKDLRDAVEAALKAKSWTSASGHARAQVLYYLAENLEARAGDFARRISEATGANPKAAAAEVSAAIRRTFTYAAWADKFDGQVHGAPLRGVAMAMNEPLGVIGIACGEESPLLGLLSLVLPAVAMGNRTVVLPSPAAPLVATELYQVLDTSDVPGGVINLVTGARDPLAYVLADHDGVDALWYFGGLLGAEEVERRSAGNLKRTFTNRGRRWNWTDQTQGEGPAFLRQATQIKNIWIPYGE